MSKKKCFKRKKSKYADEAFIAESKIVKIDFVNQEVGNSLKSVFYCSSYEKPEGRMCIAYGKYNINVGDEVVMKGRYNDGVFLVWSMYIKKKADEAEIKDSNDNTEIDNKSIS